MIRHVQYAGGVVDRLTHGTIRYGLENLGRELVLVDWDTGRTTMVFPDDIVLVDGETAGASN